MLPFLLISTFVVGLLSVVAWFVTGQWYPAWCTQALVFAAGVNLVASWLSFIPLAVVRRKHWDYIPQAAMGAMVIRILLVTFVLLAAMAWGPWNSMILSIWMLAFYLSLLVVETAMAVRLVGHSAPESGADLGSASLGSASLGSAGFGSAGPGSREKAST